MTHPSFDLNGLIYRLLALYTLLCIGFGLAIGLSITYARIRAEDSNGNSIEAEINSSSSIEKPADEDAFTNDTAPLQLE